MLLSLPFLAVAALVTPPVPTITESAVLDAPSPTTSPTFGMIVGISGDRVIAAGPEPARISGSVGQVATFELEPTGSWRTYKEMLSIDNTPVGNLVLGRAVLGGNSLLVSDERRDGGNSCIVTFERDSSASGWKYVGRLQPLASASEPAFGGVLACDGSIAAIGTVDLRVLGEAPRTVQESPKVYLFKNGPEGWKGLGFLQRDAALKPTFFGASLSMSPGQIVVACPNAIPAAPHQKLVTGGASVVVVYRQTAAGLWGIDGELTPPPGNPDWLGFGVTVASDSNTIAVRMAKITAPAGKVFVYRRGDAGWNYEGELAPLTDVVPGSGWGVALAIADGRVILGDPSALAGQSTGYLGVFARRDDGVWGESVRLRPTVPVSSARWGVSVRAEGTRVIVARSTSEREGVVPGGALVYNLPPISQLPPVIPVELVPASSAPLDAGSGAPR